MKKTLLIIQWIVSCFIILMGLANIINSPLGAIFLIISGVIILPPILKIIKDKFKKNGNIISITICTVAFILGIAITGSSSTANNTNEIAMQNQQNTTITNNTINNISSNNIQNKVTNDAVNNIVENNANTQTTNEVKTTPEEQTTNKAVENNTNISKTKSNKTTTTSNTKKTTTQKQETTSSNTNTQTKRKTQTTQSSTSSTSEGGYIVNRNSHVFHKPNCPSVKRMNESNKIYSSKSRAELINEGCKTCNNCNP